MTRARRWRRRRVRRRLLRGAGCTTTCCSWWAHTLQLLHRRRLRSRDQHAGNSLSQCQARRLQQRQSQGLLAVLGLAVLQLQLLSPARQLLKVLHKELLWRVSKTEQCWTRLSSLPCTRCWPLFKRVRTCDGCNGDARGLSGCCCLSSCICLCVVACNKHYPQQHSRQRTRLPTLSLTLQPQAVAHSCRRREYLTLHPRRCSFCLPFMLTNVYDSGCTPFRPAVLCTMHFCRMCFLGSAGLRSEHCWLYLLAACRVLGMAQFSLHPRLFAGTGGCRCIEDAFLLTGADKSRYRIYCARAAHQP